MAAALICVARFWTWFLVFAQQDLAQASNSCCVLKLQLEAANFGSKTRDLTFSKIYIFVQRMFLGDGDVSSMGVLQLIAALCSFDSACCSGKVATDGKQHRRYSNDAKCIVTYREEDIFCRWNLVAFVWKQSLANYFEQSLAQLQ